jgi:hypothetical protein
MKKMLSSKASTLSVADNPKAMSDSVLVKSVREGDATNDWKALLRDFSRSPLEAVPKDWEYTDPYRAMSPLRQNIWQQYFAKVRLNGKLNRKRYKNCFFISLK